MRKRILAFFLTLCIVLSMLPVMAFADTTDAPATQPADKSFSELLADSETTQIKLTQNEMIVATISKNVEIDLNGFELSGTILVADGYVATVKDSQLTGSVVAQIIAEYDAFVIVSAGLITDALLPYVSNTSKISDSNKIEVAATEEIPYKVGNDTFVRWEDAVAAGNHIEIIQNAGFSGLSISKDLFISIADDVKFEVASIYVNGATVTVTGGEIEFYAVLSAEGGLLVLDGANVKMMQTTAFQADTGALLIKSGYYALDVSEYLAEGLMQLGGLVVEEKEAAVAYIGTTAYYTLAEAIVAANGGKTIVLVQDVDTTLNIAAGTNIVIELNGYNFTTDATILNYGTIIVEAEILNEGSVSKLINMGIATLKSGVFSSVENGGTLKITGDAVINTMSNTGDLQISGGFFAEEVAETLVFPNDFVDNYYLATVDGSAYIGVIAYEAFIVNGTDVEFFANVADAWESNALVDGAVVYLYADAGKCYIGADIEIVLGDGVEITNVTVAEGVVVTIPCGNTKYAYGAGFYATIVAPVAQIGDVYYMTLTDAINAVPSRGTEATVITILADEIVVDGTIVITGKKNVVIDFAGATVKVNASATYALYISDSSEVALTGGKFISSVDCAIRSIGTLALDTMDIDGSVSIYRLTATITDTVINALENGVALELKALAKYASYAFPTVIINGDSEINGDILFEAEAITFTSEEDVLDMSLIINDGIFAGEILFNAYAFPAVDYILINAGTFTGIEDYETFFILCQNTGMFPMEQEDGSYVVVADEDDCDFVVSVTVSGLTVYYNNFEQALALAYQSEGATIRLEANYNDVLVLEEVPHNLTLNLSKYSLGGIVYSSADDESGALYTLTVVAAHSRASTALKGSVVIGAGEVDLSGTNTLNVNISDAPLFVLLSDDAFATITGAKVTVKKCDAIVEVAEGVEEENILISRGVFSCFKPAYELIDNQCTLVVDAKGTTWTVTPSNPGAVVVNEDGIEVERYATFAEAVAAALEGNYPLVEIIRYNSTDDYSLDLPADVTLIILNNTDATIIVVEDDDTFTRDMGGDIYTGFATYAIINSSIYCAGWEEVIEELAEVTDKIEIFVPNSISELYVEASGKDVTLTLAEGATIDTFGVVSGEVKYANLFYTEGVYFNTLTYNARVNAKVYATVTDAVKLGQTIITVVIDAYFEILLPSVNVTLIYNGTSARYGYGAYESLEDVCVTDARGVLYSSVEDAVLGYAFNDAGTEIVSLTLLCDIDEAMLIDATADFIYLNAAGFTIESIDVVGNRRVLIENATVAKGISKDNAATLILKNVDADTLDVTTEGEIHLRGSINLGAINFASPATLVAAANLSDFVYIGSIYFAVGGNYVINTDNASFYVADVEFNNVAKKIAISGSISAGTIVAEHIGPFKPALAEGYGFTKLYNEGGEGYFFTVIPTEDIVAEVDGVLYADLETALYVAYVNNLAVKLMDYFTIVLTEDYDRIILANDSLDANIIVDDEDYFIIEDNGVYTRELIMAIVELDGGDVYYNDVQAAIDAANGATVNIIFMDEFTLAQDTIIKLDGTQWYVFAGEYAADYEFVAEAYTGSNKANRIYFEQIETALAYNAEERTTIYLQANIDELVVTSGSYSFSMGGNTITKLTVTDGTVSFTGTGVVGTLTVDGGKVTISAASLIVMQIVANGGETSVSAVTVPNAIVADGETLVLKAIGYVENADASITYYSSITNVKDGETVVLLKNTSCSKIRNDITIDVNGYTITKVRAYADAIVTLIGEGNVNFGDDSEVAILVNSYDLLFDETHAFADFIMEDAAEYYLTLDETIEGDYQYTFAEAVASLNGKGYASFEELVAAIDKNDEAMIVLYTDVDYANFIIADYLEIELNGYTLSCISIEVLAYFRAVDGKIVSNSDNSDSVIYAYPNATVILKDVTLGQGALYDTVTGLQASVKLEEDSILHVFDGAYVPVAIVVVTDPYAEAGICVDNAEIGTVKVYINGTLKCFNHSLEAGKCEHCGEIAKQITVEEGITVYNVQNEVLTPVNGVYYLFKEDVVYLDHGKLPAGYSFDGWYVTSDAADFEMYGNVLVVGSANAHVDIVLAPNEVVDVVINAPLFTVTGLSGNQLGTASVPVNAGAAITVTYTGDAFLANSSVVYWVNENGMIIGKGNTLTYTVSSASTITAICQQGGDDTVLVVYRNGADEIGSKIISYVSVNVADIETLALHANASLGELNVIGWKLAGTSDVLSADTFHAALEAALGTNTVLYLEPAIAKTNVTVDILLNDFDGELLAEEIVYADEYSYITAPAVEGKSFAYWIVDFERIYTQTLVYKFVADATIVAVYEDGEQGETIGDSNLRLDYSTDVEAGKIFLNGIYQVPNYLTLVEAGIVYSTTAYYDDALVIGGENVKVKKATGLEGKNNLTYNLTLNTTKDELVVFARAFLTVINSDNEIVTIYTDVEWVCYNCEPM